MAITKILHQKASPGRELGIHTKQLIAYIMNPDKTEECILTGGINCLPDTAYKQMVETKKMYRKLGGRQSYHVIISLVPREGTPEQLYEMTEKFAAEFLGGEYEAVFAIHTDHEHLHSHLVFNSVNMITGKKFQYKKGDWKYKLQPITNRLCEEYGFEVMPAEYSPDPKNVSRDEWERQQSFSEYIEADAKYCLIRAGNREHYIYLLKELGYEVKDGVHIAVKAPGMRRFKRLDTISKELDYIGSRRIIQNKEIIDERIYKTIDPRPIKRARLSPLQKKYYRRLYKLRLLEKRRFYYKSANFYKHIQLFKKLQEEYLFLLEEDIYGWDDIRSVKDDAVKKCKSISAEQKRLYQERAKARKKQEKNQELINGDDVFDEEEYKDRLKKLKNLKHSQTMRIKIADRILDEHKTNKLLEELDGISVSEYENELDTIENEENIPNLPMTLKEDSAIKNEQNINIPASDYDPEVDYIGTTAMMKMEEYKISLKEFFYLSVDDKAAIWEVSTDKLEKAFEAYRLMAKIAGLQKSSAELYSDFTDICNKNQEYKDEPHLRWYRQERLRGNNVFAEDKKLIRSKVR